MSRTRAAARRSRVAISAGGVADPEEQDERQQVRVRRDRLHRIEERPQDPLDLRSPARPDPERDADQQRDARPRRASARASRCSPPTPRAARSVDDTGRRQQRHPPAGDDARERRPRRRSTRATSSARGRRLQPSTSVVDAVLDRVQDVDEQPVRRLVLDRPRSRNASNQSSTSTTQRSGNPGVQPDEADRDDRRPTIAGPRDPSGPRAGLRRIAGADGAGRADLREALDGGATAIYSAPRPAPSSPPPRSTTPTHVVAVRRRAIGPIGVRDQRDQLLHDRCPPRRRSVGRAVAGRRRA